MSIPIQNLYYLLVYGWDVLEEAGTSVVGTDNVKVPQELFARILVNGLEHLLKRGLDRDYASETAELAGIRGRIEISQSIKMNSFSKGRLVCTYDELTHDVLHNQIIKTTLHRLIQTADLDRDLCQDLRALYDRLGDVSTITLASDTFRRIQLHSNNSFYRILLQVCWLLYQQLIPDKSNTGYQFVDFGEEQLENLFESFVRNFYKREQTVFKVSKERFSWQEVRAKDEHQVFLPRMETDVSLESSSKKIIVEVKFYKSPLIKHHYGSKKTLRSSHIYQLFSYLNNVAARSQVPVEGLLLYAKNNDDLDLEFEVFGFPVRVATVDLQDTPVTIRGRLLELLAA